MSLRTLRSIAASSAARTRLSLAKAIGHLAIGDVEGDALIADAGDRRGGKPWVLLQGVEIGRQHALDEIELPGLEIGEAHAGVGNGEEGDALEIVAAVVPIIGEFVENDAILDDPLGEFIGAGADRFGAELVARRLG